MSEVGCEPLAVGPSAEPWTLSLNVSNFPGRGGGGGEREREAPWTERRIVAICWFSHVRVAVCNSRWGPLAGPQCSVRSGWDRGAPGTVCEVAVSLQSRDAAG